MQDSVAPTPALEQSGVISNVEPTVDSAADGGFAHPEPPADADKENNVTVSPALSPAMTLLLIYRGLLGRPAGSGAEACQQRSALALHACCCWHPPTPNLIHGLQVLH